jgi:hypothetical protein
MSHKLLRVWFAALLASGLVVSGSLTAYGADAKVTVRIKSLSVNTLKVDATKEGQIVKLVGILNSSTSLQVDDIKCSNSIDSPNSKYVVIESLGNDDYRVTCTMPVSKTDMRGLMEAALGIHDGENHLGWQMVPMNARYIIPNTFIDAFGIKRSEEILGFTFQRNATSFSTPLAVSPPADYKVPSFSSGKDGYLIFESVSTASKPSVKFSKNKKTFSLNCPMPITKLNSLGKKQTFVSFWFNKSLYKPGYILGNSFEPKYYNNLEISKSLKGKTVKIACASEFKFPESNVTLAYSESAEISVKFPG